MSTIYSSVIRLNDKKGTTLNAEFSTFDWQITGLSTKATEKGTNSGNTDILGKLYVTLTGSGTQVAGRVYKSFSAGIATSIVATFTATNKTSAFATIVATSSSGLGGQVTVKYNADNVLDNPIKLQTVFSTDADLTIYENISQFQSWDLTYGLARFHNEAAHQIIDFISHRFRTELHGLTNSGGVLSTSRSYPLFSSYFISASEPDISRVHNPSQLRRASCYYSLYLLYNHDFIGGYNDVNQDRANNYLKRYQMEMNTLNLDLDHDKDGTIDDTVSGGGIPWARC
jgi:hypothetical protein